MCSKKRFNDMIQQAAQLGLCRRTEISTIGHLATPAKDREGFPAQICNRIAITTFLNRVWVGEHGTASNGRLLYARDHAQLDGSGKANHVGSSNSFLQAKSGKANEDLRQVC